MANQIDQIRYTLLNGIVVGDMIDLLQFILQQSHPTDYLKKNPPSTEIQEVNGIVNWNRDQQIINGNKLFISGTDSETGNLFTGKLACKEFYLGETTSTWSTVKDISYTVDGIIYRPNGSTAYTISYPSVTGTIALTSDITTALANYQPLITTSNKLDYALLKNTPSIPTKVSDLDNDLQFVTESQFTTALTLKENVGTCYTKVAMDSILENYYNKTESDARYVDLTSAQNITGEKTFDANTRITAGHTLMVGHPNGPYTSISNVGLSKRTDEGVVYNYTLPNKNGAIALTSIAQTIYDGIFPVGFIYYGETNPGIPNGVTASWAEQTDKNLRYLQVSSEAAGTTKAEQLPNIRGTFGRWLNNVVWSGYTTGAFAGPIQLTSLELKPDASVGSNAYTYGMSFSAAGSNSVYTDSGKVQPLTVTIKRWKRIS